MSSSSIKTFEAAAENEEEQANEVSLEGEVDDGDTGQVPPLDLEGSLKEEHKEGAPRTVNRLLARLRTQERPHQHTTNFVAFENHVKSVLTKPSDPAFRVFAFFDEAILPPGSKFGTARSGRPLSGNSPLELIFEFFCGRQQPGTSGMPTDATFDEIAQANVSMSLPELMKFALVMFPKHQFTRSELSWVMSKAKSEPFSQIETNWHGDVEGDRKMLNFVEFLSCLLRLTLIAYGTLGVSPNAAIEDVAKEMHLGDLNAVKQRLLRIARTTAGFGGWVDGHVHMDAPSQMALNMKRPGGPQDFMLPKDQMLLLQEKLLSYGRSDKNIKWLPFDGPYISMVVPTTVETGARPSRFQVVVQNLSKRPRNLNFKLKNLPFLHTQYLPSKATIIAPGMDCVFEMAAYIDRAGDYTGSVIFTDAKGENVVSVCPVFLRAVSGKALGKTIPVTKDASAPEILEPGRAAYDIHNPKSPEKTLAAMERSTAMLPLRTPSSGKESRPQVLNSRELYMPLNIRDLSAVCPNLHDPGPALPTSPTERRSVRKSTTMNYSALAPRALSPLGVGREASPAQSPPPQLSPLPDGTLPRRPDSPGVYGTRPLGPNGPVSPRSQKPLNRLAL